MSKLTFTLLLVIFGSKSLRNRKKEVPLTEDHEFIPLDEKSIEKELEFDELTYAVRQDPFTAGKRMPGNSQVFLPRKSPHQRNNRPY